MRPERGHLELLEGDLVDLVDDVDAGDVDARPLDDVHQVVDLVVLNRVDVRVVYPAPPPRSSRQ